MPTSAQDDAKTEPSRPVGRPLRPDAQECPTLANSIGRTVARTNLSRSTLYRLMESGELDYVKIGSRRLIPEQPLLDLLERHTVREAA